MEDEILDVEQEEEVVTPHEAEDDGEGREQGSQGGKSSGGADRSGQSAEDNRRYQAARHAGEQAGYERARRELNDRIARTGMRSPDGEDIEDIEGLEKAGKAFRRQTIRERARQEGRTEAEVEEDEENRAYLKAARKKDAEEKQTKAEEARRLRWAENDAAEFASAYPEADLGQLMENRKFMRFCGSRFGREPLRELYADYLEILGSAEQAGQAKSKGKSERSTGSGGGRGEEAKLTPAQQRDLEAWNRANPRMKMTAKEFLERE